MSERVIAHGTDFMVFEVTGEVGAEVYRPIAGQTNVQLTREPNYRETNNKNLGGWKDYFGGLKGWSASVEMDIPDPGDVDADEVSFEELADYEEARTKVKFLFCFVTPLSDTDEDVVPDTSRPSWEGLALVSCPVSAPPGENMTTSIALQGCRKLTKIAGV